MDLLNSLKPQGLPLEQTECRTGVLNWGLGADRDLHTPPLPL
jgi:hypothetical protein